MSDISEKEAAQYRHRLENDPEYDLDDYFAERKELAELKTLNVVTRDPTKYLLVNLEDGTFFQGQDEEEPVGEPLIRRLATLMWKRPQNIETVLCAIDVLLDAAIEIAREKNG